MTFDADTLWRTDRGTVPAVAQPSPAVALLPDVLPTLGPIHDVLDVGCGAGRIGALLLDVLPAATYSGLDISAAQVEASRRVRPDGTFYQARLQDFDPGRTWQLVIVSEVLMHIPPADIAAACDRLRALASRWIVAVEWTEPVAGPIAEWNWLHDYGALLDVERVIPAGRQSILLVRGR